MSEPSAPPELPPRQRELLNWFRENAEPLAIAYEGAIRLLAEAAFPGRVHFIGHAVRDVADRLVYVLDPQLEGNRVQYENKMDRIEKDWPTIQTIHEKPERNQINIEYKLAVMINSLVTDHRERRKRPSNYELLFRYLMKNEPSKAAVNRRLIDDFKKTRDWFMERTHFRANTALKIEEADLHSQFSRFEGMLHSFVGNFFTGTRELDAILQQANQ